MGDFYKTENTETFFFFSFESRLETRVRGGGVGLKTRALGNPTVFGALGPGSGL